MKSEVDNSSADFSPRSTLPAARIEKIRNAQNKFPKSFLGPHKYKDGEESGIAVRFFYLNAKSAWVEEAGEKKIAMEKIHEEGIFEARFPNRAEIFDYKLHVTTAEGKSRILEDPYHPKFKSLIPPRAAQSFESGSHFRSWELLGGRLARNAGISGVNFVVWAPNARAVTVAGAFNHWSGRSHPMHFTGKSGLWELFIPGLKEGAFYKFMIRTMSNRTLVKADPYAFAAQFRPKKSSIVWNLDKFKWTDAEWLSTRTEKKHYQSPMSVYEVHLGSWMRKATSDTPFYNYREIAEKLIPYVKEMGFTHVELMPVLEHPLDESWGYQVTSYFAPTARYGSPDDFMAFVNACHEAGIGVIVDWVPAHFPRDRHGLARFDGTALYEHADPRQGFHPDWKTAIFNFGRNEVKSFLISSAVFWIQKYHIDAIRVDAVASMLYLDYSRKAGQWIPNKYGGNENLEAIDFLRAFNKEVIENCPGAITIAEESTAWPGITKPHYTGGIGFSFKWNMGWMHDTLEYLSKSPRNRRYHHGKLTFMLDYAFREKYILVLSHDEVVHGKRSLIAKMPGTREEKFANLRLLYGFQAAHPGKKLLFMGGEFAQWGEWGVNRELDWKLRENPDHEKIRRYVLDLNAFYRSEPALWEEDHHPRSFAWMDSHDMDQSVASFLRMSTDEKELLLFVFNFSDAARPGYRVGVPRAEWWSERFNSNAGIYGGTNAGNLPGVWANKNHGHHGKPHSVALNLPPLSMTVMRSVLPEPMEGD